MKQGVKDPSNGWGQACFHINWRQDTNPLWHVDLLLAHQIISPILSDKQDSIGLWRIHRMADPENLNHQFSFKFFSSRGIANKIYETIQKNPILINARASGIIVNDTYDENLLPNIEDTSHVDWPEPIKRSWPYFIMGVSQMWLKLISEFSDVDSDREKQTTIDELLIFYKCINDKINELWKVKGQHSFLHHLNAVFGYEPLIIQRSMLMAF